MRVNEQISALVLAGGRGSRMGNLDKGLQAFLGTPMVSHVLARLRGQVSHIAISANRNLDAYRALGVPVLPDDTPDFPGPLEGLAVALRHCTTPYLLVVPCDCPLLPLDLAERLFTPLDARGADVAYAATRAQDGSIQPHPVFCLVRTSSLPQLSAYLASGERRVQGWQKSLKSVQVMFDDQEAFLNVNTLEELRSLNERASTLPAAYMTASEPPDGMRVPEAQRLIAATVQPVPAHELVGLRAALGRVLARDLVSPINVPAYDNSAMDGYAFNARSLPDVASVTLKVAGIAYAGRPVSVVPGPGECVRIMTGARIPEGCDSVLPQELVQKASDSEITLRPASVRVGDNVRYTGEDLETGSPALLAGRILRPADLGLVASLGFAEVPVRKRLRVAFFSTGDELRAAGEPLDAGCVYDSNRYTIWGMLERLGCDILDMGIVKDDPGALEAAFRSACEHADAIITSGGVSVGAADHTREVMARLGEVAFWKLRMRPGRPLAFGRIHSGSHSAILFGLPGNPVAVMVSFYFFARDALLRMMGASVPTSAQLPLLRARAISTIRKKPGRTEYQRGIVSRHPDGSIEVRLTGAQGSGILRSMSEANCIVVLAEEQGTVEAGNLVDIVPFEGLV